MKKSNLILSAIGLISIIGGVLAFKAQNRFTGTLFCYTTIGIIIGNKRIYVPVLITKYIHIETGTTLFCTIPGPNKTYIAVKVETSL
ncbi:hypothetical protein [Chitinophaga silvisoli]|uniref:Uncharacterized protein n=1 Tax=Chitinophaga silvisoli TaxID=2291814 RepID=A0A3E1P3V9_9BACT|nr:hypothetical protein [Chitinophaga silvisoli]RFM34688.1 hypothetical protein DXN04_15605 [Chitinophaga silvisoli]